MSRRRVLKNGTLVICAHGLHYYTNCWGDTYTREDICTRRREMAASEIARRVAAQQEGGTTP